MKDLKNTFVVEDNLADDSYRKFCVALAAARNSDDYSEVEDLIDEDIVFIRYRREIVKGREQFVAYWRRMWKHWADNHLVVESHIKHCNAWGHIAIDDRRNKGGSTYLLVLMDKGKAVKAIVAPNPLQDPMIRYCTLDNAMDCWEGLTITEKISAQPLRLPCPCCGLDSEHLDWHNFQVRRGPLGYFGEISECPDCKCKVEIYPTVLLRY